MIEKVFLAQAYNKLELEKFFAKKLARAGFNRLEIVKTPVATKVIIYVARPGLAIGYSGKNIKLLGTKLEKQYNMKNPHIEVKAIEHPEYDVRYRIDSLINALEKGTPWRNVIYKVARELSALPLMGYELMLKGKLMAKGGRKQKYRIAEGYLKKVGDQVSLVKTGKGTAYTKSGAIGITLSLITPNTIFPDKVDKKDIYAAAEGKYSVAKTTVAEVKEVKADAVVKQEADAQ